MRGKTWSDEYKRGYDAGYRVGVKERKKKLVNFAKAIVTNDGKFFEADEFICSHCGLHLEDWVGRDTDGSAYEFTFRFCPNCGGEVGKDAGSR